MLRPMIVAAAALVAIAGGCKNNDRDTNNQADSTVRGQNRAAEADRAFVRDAASSNMKEVQASQLALKQAESPEVRRFAQMMVDEHNRATQELRDNASRANIPVPSAMTDQHQRDLARLRESSSRSFDRLYMQQMVEDHTRAIEVFERQATTGADTQLRAFAQQTLPKLRQHLDEARQISGRINAGSQNQGQYQNQNQPQWRNEPMRNDPMRDSGQEPRDNQGQPPAGEDPNSAPRPEQQPR